MNAPDVRPVCMYCLQRFSLRPGETASGCESWRALNGEHVERRVATPEQHARLKLDAPPVVDKAAPKGIPSPTSFDADALRAGKPATGQSSLF